MPNLTLPLVYSWPGYNTFVSSYANCGFRFPSTHVDLGVIRQSSKSLVQSLVHLLGSAFEETTTTYYSISLLSITNVLVLILTADEKSVSGEDDLLVAVLEQEANAVLRVARGV